MRESYPAFCADCCLFRPPKSPHNISTFLAFFSQHLAISEKCYTFAAVSNSNMTYQMSGASPEQDFFENLANFTSDRLVVSDKLLHTHTQPIWRTSGYFLSFFLRAREARQPHTDKGICKDAFVCFFVPFCQVGKGRNKPKFIHQNKVKVWRRKQVI